jgi:hypothetical protein
MSKVNGKKAQIMVDMFSKNNGSITPTQLLKELGTQRRVNSVLWNARRAGVVFDSVRDGRKIISFNLISADKIEVPEEKVKVSKTVKSTPVKLTIAEENRRIKAAEAKPKSKPTAKAAAKKVKKDKPVFDMGKDEVERQFGSSGEVATSYSVDPDWDSFDDSDIPAFLK